MFYITNKKSMLHTIVIEAFGRHATSPWKLDRRQKQ